MLSAQCMFLTFMSPSEPCYIAIYDYLAGDDDEVSFNKGIVALITTA